MPVNPVDVGELLARTLREIDESVKEGRLFLV